MLRVISNSNEIGQMIVAVPRVLLSVSPSATSDLEEHLHLQTFVKISNLARVISDSLKVMTSVRMVRAKWGVLL